MGELMVGLRGLWKPAIAMALIGVSAVANAVTVQLVRHNQTSSSGAISTLITDGSHVQGQPATTAVFDWDGTTLSSTGLYSALSSLGSSPYGPTVLNDRITDLSINTGAGTATATAYACHEGTFLAGVGASGCGGHNLGANYFNESTTTWGPGLAFSRTIGGDDVATGTQRSISAYDFGTVSLTGTGLNTGDQVRIGNGIPVGTPGGELIIFDVVSSAVAVDDTASGRANEVINIAVLANDTLVDNITALTTASVSNGTAVLNGTPPGPKAGLSVDYRSAIGFSGNATFDYTVTDADGFPVTGSVTIAVSNQAPTAVNDTAATAVATPVVVNVLANDTLGDGPSRSVDVTSGPTNGSVTTTLPVTCTVPANCALSYTPNGGHTGPDTFTYQLTDANGDTATATVTVTTSAGLAAANDSATTEIATPVVINVLANDVGLVNPDFTVDVTTGPTKGTVTTTLPVTCTVPANCALSYTPGAGQVGNDTFVYSLTDNLAATDSATVTVFINDVPVAVDDTLPALTAIATSLAVQANDTGRNDTPIVVSIVGAPSSGTAVPDGSNPQRVTYTSAAGFVGVDSFTYRLDDDNGDTSNTATVTVNVDDQPVANNDGTMGAPLFTVAPGTTVALNVLGNDTGLSDTPLTVTIVNPAAALGSPVVTGSPGNAAAIRVNYTAGTTLGTDAFGYQIMDNSGNTATATAYVAVAAQNIPVAFDDAVSTYAIPEFAGGEEDFVFLDVLANDQGLADAPLLVTITSDPANGIIGAIQGCLQNGTFCQVSYRPNEGFSGTDSYQYMVTDGNGDSSNVATVTVTVDEVPVAVNDASSTTAGTPVTIDVLANDTGLSFPPLTVTIIGLLANGTVGTPTVQPDNTILYTPLAGSIVTTDTFDYRVIDANGNSSLATVTVTISLNQAGLPGSGSSAVGPVGIGLLMWLVGLRRRRQDVR